MVMVSPELVDKSFSRRLRLNRRILENRYWMFRVDDVGHENYEPVGRGVPSSPLCGRWVGFNVCFDVEAHKGVFVNGEDCTDKVVVRHKHMFCNKSSCPICFISGWSTRRARGVEGRFVEADRRGFGKVEHVVVSVAVADRCLPESVLRKKCRDALKDRSIVGGCMIFHGYRVDKKRRVLVWSPHYHSLGFVEGGFDRCRECVHNREDCSSCDGLKGREVRGFENDGILVKVMSKRKTVFGTAYYQLHHATIRVGVTRFHCVTWFGSCGNRKFRSEKVMVEVSCPACGGDMIRSFHNGIDHIVKAVSEFGYQSVFCYPQFGEDGELNFVKVVGSRFG